MRCSCELPGSATLPCLRLAIFKNNFKQESRLLPSILALFFGHLFQASSQRATKGRKKQQGIRCLSGNSWPG